MVVVFVVDNGEQGSCNRRRRLFVSCQNRAGMPIPRDAVWPGGSVPMNSCVPELLPEETLSVSDAVVVLVVRLQARADPLSESPLMLILADPLSKSESVLPWNKTRLRSSSTKIDCCNDRTASPPDFRFSLEKSKLLIVGSDGRILPGQRCCSTSFEFSD